MSRQAILAFSAIGPLFINENGTRQGNAGGVFIDETSGAAPSGDAQAPNSYHRMGPPGHPQMGPP